MATRTHTRSILRLAALLSLLAGVAPVAGAWRIETIATGQGHVPRRVRLAVDAAARVHLVSVRTIGQVPSLGFGGFTYATNASGSWEVDAGAAGSDDYSDAPRIRMDPLRGIVDLVFFGDGEQRLARRDSAGGPWSTAAIPAEAFAQAMTVDRDGHLHFAFFWGCELGDCGCDEDSSRGGIQYANDTDGFIPSFVFQTDCIPLSAAPTDRHSDDLEIAVAEDGTVHLVWIDAWTGGIRYARGGGAAWSIEPLASVAADTFAWAGVDAIAVDGAGHPHVVYFDQAGYSIHYLTNAGAGWEGVTLATTAAYPRVIVDPAGGVHVLYDVPFRGFDGLHHAWRAPGQPATLWRDEKIAPVRGDVEGDIVVDEGGRLHVAYQEPASGTLFYVTSRSSAACVALADCRHAVHVALPVRQPIPGKKGAFTRRLAHRMARLDAAAGRVLHAAEGASGRRQKRLSAKGRRTLEALVVLARTAVNGGGFSDTLPALEAAVAQLLARVSS